MKAEISLEFLNGNWMIASASLMVICIFYLGHELLSRDSFLPGAERRHATRMTQGMRVATSVLTMSFGVFIRSVETWRWRAWGGGLNDLNQQTLLIGGVIAVIGFLCAIRELSAPLYGRGPWVWTVVAMMIFNAVTLFSKFH